MAISKLSPADQAAAAAWAGSGGNISVVQQALKTSSYGGVNYAAPTSAPTSASPSSGSGGGSSPAPTLASVQQSANALIDRLKTEGLTNSSGVQTHSYNAASNIFTPTPQTPPPATTTPAATYTAPDLKDTYNVYDNFIKFLLNEDEQQEVRDRFTGLGQPLVENIQNQTSLMMADAKRAANELMARNRALMSRSGLAGSQFDTRSIADAEKYNMQQEQRIQAEQDRKILDVTKELTSMSENVIAKNKELALQSANMKADTKMKEAMKGIEADYTTASINKMKQDIEVAAQTMKYENIEKSMSIAEYLAKSGVSFEKLPFSTQSMLKTNTGLSDDTLSLYMNSKKAEGERIDYKAHVVGDTLVYSGIDPKTNQVVTKSFAFPKATSAEDEWNQDIKVTEKTVEDLNKHIKTTIQYFTVIRVNKKTGETETFVMTPEEMAAKQVEEELKARNEEMYKAIFKYTPSPSSMWTK